MASSLFSIASSGLKAANLALSTTSNNIANANTDGYNRQSVQLAQTSGKVTSFGSVGTGVTVLSINRAYDSLVVSQLRAATTSYESTNAYYEQISQVDNLLSDSDTSLSTMMSSFFSGLQSLTTNASDTSARQTVISSAESLVNQFASANDYLSDMDSSINQQLSTNVDLVNSYTSQIAEINDQITRLGSSGSSANALLDQRDLLIDNLNKLVGVSVSTQGNNIINVSLSNGQTLVQGDTSYQLVAVKSSSDTSRTTIAYDNGIGDPVEIDESSLSGGSISGLLSFRSEVLDSSRNQLGLIALTLADSFNTQHSAGVDLNGDAGTNFFSFSQPEVSSNTQNSGTATLSAVYTDTSAVKASDYTVTYDGSAWQVTRMSDGASVTATSATDSDGNTTLSFEGLTLTVNGDAQEDDSFLLKPLSSVINSLSVSVTDVAKVAAGSGGGESDNSNALKLLDLQNQNLVGGNATLNDAYASLISDIGVKAKSAENNSSTQSTIVSQLTEKQQSISGIDTNEEYVDLTRYQQYYLANAKVLATAGTIFDSLLSAVSS
ncbi:flagellar hook-associated protein FlgK [Brenneria goodwinii]|uniref:Flagellar hook-associated protein 1 n=1 Tax=Brenneria goodwinii TaxID=1109412 RepID=A0A0G4K1U1_9GAMM|nr:flagellar hook-associated protein FlgK [Brenneria goodwinii]MCG8158122.1 flagellar hook-associated protein FlgK [Brenneria goodwinii]MCG8162463.1 flagellar hook-associated protein FlgK [Brenneria goodwinii]MCG8167173.1 flagellar hook-associated protein FlgK [Brenneria goodwinii]MCG8171833.1 flagellar hook-associated protein FlgK [Brenneria goodwinii]MCG8176535.1 flagellar hook-associated protein FlgK [Brenneria goodwinii]